MPCASCFLLLLAPLSAQTKIPFAVVDYGILSKEYYKAVESKQRFDKKRDEFSKDMEERLGVANNILRDAKKLQEDLQSPVLSEAKKKEITGKLREKQIEFEGRQKMAMDYRDQALGLMQKNQMAETEAILGEINKALNVVIKNKYTMVIAKPQGPPMPGMITLTDGFDDITLQVLAILNKDAPGNAKKDEKK